LGLRACAAALGLVTVGLVAAPAFGATPAEQQLADRYAPILAFQEQSVECGDGEPYRPISVDDVLGNPDVTLHGPDGVVKTGPTAADLYGKPDGYYLDLPGNPLDPGCSLLPGNRNVPHWNAVIWSTNRPYHQLPEIIIGNLPCANAVPMSSARIPAESFGT
jgi:hypothetical protein